MWAFYRLSVGASAVLADSIDINMNIGHQTQRHLDMDLDVDIGDIYTIIYTIRYLYYNLYYKISVL